VGVENPKIDNSFNNQNSGFTNPSKVEKSKEKDTTNEISSDFKKKLANKKAISSDDFADENGQDNQVKAKLNNLKGQTAISSDDLFGNGVKEDEKSLGSSLKDYALSFTLKAAEKAKGIKDGAKKSDQHNPRKV